MLDWPENDFRIFVGDLGNEANDDVLTKAFNKYATFQKARIVRDKKSNKTKGAPSKLAALLCCCLAAWIPRAKTCWTLWIWLQCWSVLQGMALSAFQMQWREPRRFARWTASTLAIGPASCESLPGRCACRSCCCSYRSTSCSLAWAGLHHLSEHPRGGVASAAVGLACTPYLDHRARVSSIPGSCVAVLMPVGLLEPAEPLQIHHTLHLHSDPKSAGSCHAQLAHHA